MTNIYASHCQRMQRDHANAVDLPAQADMYFHPRSEHSVDGRALSRWNDTPRASSYRYTFLTVLFSSLTVCVRMEWYAYLESETGPHICVCFSLNLVFL